MGNKITDMVIKPGTEAFYVTNKTAYYTNMIVLTEQYNSDIFSLSFMFGLCLLFFTISILSCSIYFYHYKQNYGQDCSKITDGKYLQMMENPNLVKLEQIKERRHKNEKDKGASSKRDGEGKFFVEHETNVKQ